ncbi:MAG: hypothetical protein JW929_00275 [Anaerolineales bacterium]|nr:hypothetical protein [Anaerolineales bacterium]
MSNRKRAGNILPLFVLGALIGCGPIALYPTSTPALPSAAATATATRTLPPPSDTPTATPTKTPIPTEDVPPYPTPWPEGFTPTARPTPTRGLAPTATLGAMQSCPAPTEEIPDVHGLDNPAEYEAMLLAYLAARGELETFREAVVAGGGPIPEEYLRITVVHAEVDNDSVEEWILSIRQPFAAEGISTPSGGEAHRTAVFVIGCRDRRYATLKVLVLDRAEGDMASGLLAVTDLNANGVNEIVIATVESVSEQGGQSLFAKVLEWEGENFRELLLPEGGGSADRALNAGVEFRDVDGNGTREILLPWNAWPDGAGVDCELGPGRNSAAVWMWDGDRYHYMWREFAPPQYRFQAAYDGDYYAYLGLYRAAETMYLRAVYDSSLRPASPADWQKDGGCPAADGLTPNPAEQQKIRAYAWLRLVELFVRVGRVREAEMHWDYLRKGYPIGVPGHIYAYLGSAFWWEYAKDSDISAACAAVRREAQKFEAEVFGPFGSYGAHNPGPTLESICPFDAPPGGT